jgi:hypothetical protein
MEDAENARRMLENPTIVASPMGPVLADYLLDYLPFETETDKMTTSVRLILQPGLLDDERRDELWQKSGRKQAYLLGFLHALPDALPQPVPARVDAERIRAVLAPQRDNPCAQLLLRSVGAEGQTYLKTVSAVLSKPPNQDVVTAALDCLRDYYGRLRPEGDPKLPLDELLAEAERFVSEEGASDHVRAVLALLPESGADIHAMRVLSGVGYGVIRPVLRDPTTLGSLMRRKLAPVLDPLQQQISRLRGEER